jgi:glycosyltransferase involved in cell wall biosynthesis
VSLLAKYPQSGREVVLSTSITIVIPSLNCGDRLKVLLASIRRQSTPPSDIIVVDGGSTDDSNCVAASAGARIIADIGPGDRRSAAKNLGARASSSDSLLFLDSDMELSSTVVEECVALSGAGCKAGVFPEVSLSPGTIGRMRRWQRAIDQTSDYLVFPRLMKRDLFLAIGGFDEELSHLEDLDVEAKILETGVHPARAKSIIYHHEEHINWALYLKKQSLYSGGRRHYTMKHPTASRNLFSIPKRIELYLTGLKGSDDVLPFLLTVLSRTLAVIAPRPRGYDWPSS